LSSTPARANHASHASHLYGGQAVVEGVMMRGANHWAVAVREPSGDIYVESHAIDSIAERHPILKKPFLRGVMVLGQSLSIGVRALLIAQQHAMEEEEQLSRGAVGFALAIALVVFVAVFVLGPTTLFAWVGRHVNHDRVLLNAAEGVFRVLLFVAYLWLIGRSKEIARVFQYHGAEHETIAAYEHEDELVPERIERYPKEHVRCGTNFLIIVLVVTIFVFTFFGTPGFLWRIVSRLIAIPIIAAVAYEALRLGARFPDSALMRALMTPGIWLQKITTKDPTTDQIEVAVASFRQVLRSEARPGDAENERLR
jgi:uncharacterized protein YqhQ